MILNIRGWSFNTHDVRQMRYRYSLSRLILSFETQVIEIEMPREQAEYYLRQIKWAWQTE